MRKDKKAWLIGLVIIVGILFVISQIGGGGQIIPLGSGDTNSTSSLEDSGLPLWRNK